MKVSKFGRKIILMKHCLMFKVKKLNITLLLSLAFYCNEWNEFFYLAFVEKWISVCEKIFSVELFVVNKNDVSMK